MLFAEVFLLFAVVLFVLFAVVCFVRGGLISGHHVLARFAACSKSCGFQVQNHTVIETTRVFICDLNISFRA